MVARDGIEPPTPAFSGLVSAGLISLTIKHLTRFLPSQNRPQVQPNATRRPAWVCSQSSRSSIRKRPHNPDYQRWQHAGCQRRGLTKDTQLPSSQTLRHLREAQVVRYSETRIMKARWTSKDPKQIRTGPSPFTASEAELIQRGRVKDKDVVEIAAW